MPSTGPPARANAADRGHDRGEAGDGAGAQVVAVGESSRQDDDVGRLRATCPCARRTRRPGRARPSPRDTRRDRSWNPERRRHQISWARSSLAQLPVLRVDLDPVALDDRIGEHLVGDFRGELARLVGRSRRSRARSTCPAARRRRPCSRANAARRRSSSLRVEHGRLQRHEHSSFHRSPDLPRAGRRQLAHRGAPTLRRGRLRNTRSITRHVAQLIVERTPSPSRPAAGRSSRRGRRAAAALKSRCS